MAVFPTLIAPNAASLRLQSLCAMPAESEIESAIHSWLLLPAMRFSKINPTVCIQILCDYTNVRNSLFRLLAASSWGARAPWLPRLVCSVQVAAGIMSYVK